MCMDSKMQVIEFHGEKVEKFTILLLPLLPLQP